MIRATVLITVLLFLLGKDLALRIEKFRKLPNGQFSRGLLSNESVSKYNWLQYTEQKLFYFGYQSTDVRNLVSIYDLISETWTHRMPNNTETDEFSENFEKHFALKGRLFNLVIISTNYTADFRTLSYLRGDRWNPVRMAFGYQRCNRSYEYLATDIVVPNGDENSAYFGLICGDFPETDTLDFFRLRLSEYGDQLEATIEYYDGGSINGISVMSPFAVTSDGTIFALNWYQSNEECSILSSSENESNFAQFLAERRTPAKRLTFCRRHHQYLQIADEWLFVGGRSSAGAIDADKDRRIRSLNLDNFKWRDVGVDAPSGHAVTVDVRNKLLYAVTVEDGVQIANIIV